MASQRGYNKSATLAATRITTLVVVSGIVLTALSLGGCPGSTPIVPVNPGSTGTGTSLQVPGTGSGTSQPIVNFLAPVTDEEVAPGDTVAITWTVTDPDSNAQYTIVLDPDGVPSNGNEIVLVRGFSSDVPASGQTYLLQTTGLATGTYLVRCTASDGVNPTVQVTSSGRIRLFPAGLSHKNRPPFVTATEPSSIRGVVQGDVVRFSWCARDPDDPQARILILLDYDDNPDNDVVFHTKAEVDAICGGTLPRQVNGAILLQCDQANGCTDPTKGSTLDWIIDVGDIPPRSDGLPYRVRVDITDQTTDNLTMHSYAPGGIMVLPAINTAIVDVGQVGRTLGGAVFQGFDAGGRVGQAFTRVPDLNNDAADEFLLVAQYGHTFERGPVGAAFMVYGRPLAAPATQPTDPPGLGSRFAGLIPVNSIGTTIAGVGFEGPEVETTEGITNVAYVPDLDGDGRPEILFGMPRAQAMYDNHDDDPCDHGPVGCYDDLWPNPLSTNPDSPRPREDQIGSSDHREGNACGIICSNDQDLTVMTPIISGYMIYVSSKDFYIVDDKTNVTTYRNGFLDLSDVGGAEAGARFRGAWYDNDSTQVDFPYRIVPNTHYGATVASMPDLMNPEAANQRGGSAHRDGFAETLVSAPDAVNGRGKVTIQPGQDFSTADFSGRGDQGGFNSFPHYLSIDCTPPCFVSRGTDTPAKVDFVGSAIGDHLGYATAAGDFNLDGNQDILMGAPGASRDGLNGNGILYIVFGRLDLGDFFFGQQNPPRVEIHGISPGEGLGTVQRLVDDVNGDSVPDVAFGSQHFAPNGLPDAGEVGVILGGRQLTGENIFNETQVATNQLPGVRFLGTQSGGLAGSHIASAGDFNGDGFGDLLVVAPNETRATGGQVRRGVVYLIFGGRHLTNKTFLLSQVGTADLPGIIFVSPYAVGTADEAPLEVAEGVGDVDGDGFADIMIGAPAADYINPAAPSQRRIDAGEAYLIYGTNRITPIGG